MLFLVVRLLQFDCFVAPASGLRAAAAQAADAARTNPTEDILEVDKLLSAGTKRIRFSRICVRCMLEKIHCDFFILYFPCRFSYETRSFRRMRFGCDVCSEARFCERALQCLDR